ncbi:hypothetical protein JCM10212_005854 [Sporobolomyces blumeae]
MGSSDSASPSTSARPSEAAHNLRAILSRPLPLDLSTQDLDEITRHLCDSANDAPAVHSLALAIFARATSPSASPNTRTAFRDSIASSFAGTDSNDLVRGLSTLSALLNVSPTFASSLLTDPTIRLSLEQVVEHISHPVSGTRRTGAANEGKGKARQDEETVALVDLLALASGQPEMRNLVQSSAGAWLENLLGEPSPKSGIVEQATEADTTRARIKASAAVGIVKLRMGSTSKDDSTGLPTPRLDEESSKWTLDKLAGLFVQLVVGLAPTSKLSPGSALDDRILLPALEGLAYVTLSSSHRTKTIASTPALLSILFSLAPKTPEPPSTAAHAARDFALATLLEHLVAYPPLEDGSSNEAQINRLKRFASAGASKGSRVESPETAEQVEERISRIVRHDTSPMPTIRQFCLSSSPQTRRLAGSILHSFVTPQPLRGILLQAGTARLLLSLVRQLFTPFNAGTDLAPVQALAKVLITANPLLVFGPTPSSPLLVEATSALTLPLGAADPSSVPLLATFESLMALTNVASLDPELTDKVARFALRDRPNLKLLDRVEELFLSENKMVRRAATELCCNLVGSEAGIEHFEPPSLSKPDASDASNRTAASRLHLLLALSTSDDVPTRLASSGALTSLVYSPSISTTIATSDKLVKLFVALLTDDEAGVRHRAYEAWRGLAETIRDAKGADGSDERTKNAVSALRQGKAIDALRRAREAENVRELRKSVDGAIEAVESLVP